MPELENRAERVRALGACFMVMKNPGHFVGLEIEPGWVSLLEDLCGEFEKWQDREPVRIIQVKEKFGGLRVYRAGGFEETDLAVSFAEGVAWRTCQICGCRGRLRNAGSGWWATLCSVHHKASKSGERNWREVVGEDDPLAPLSISLETGDRGQYLQLTDLYTGKGVGSADMGRADGMAIFEGFIEAGQPLVTLHSDAVRPHLTPRLSKQLESAPFWLRDLGAEHGRDLYEIEQRLAAAEAEDQGKVMAEAWRWIVGLKPLKGKI